MQTGRLRQYVMLIVVGTVALFMLISVFLELCREADLSESAATMHSGRLTSEHFRLWINPYVCAA